MLKVANFRINTPSPDKQLYLQTRIEIHMPVL